MAPKWLDHWTTWAGECSHNFLLMPSEMDKGQALNTCYWNTHRRNYYSQFRFSFHLARVFRSYSSLDRIPKMVNVHDLVVQGFWMPDVLPITRPTAWDHWKEYKCWWGKINHRTSSSAGLPFHLEPSFLHLRFSFYWTLRVYKLHLLT